MIIKFYSDDSPLICLVFIWLPLYFASVVHKVWYRCQWGDSWHTTMAGNKYENELNNIIIIISINNCSDTEKVVKTQNFQTSVFIMYWIFSLLISLASFLSKNRNSSTWEQTSVNYEARYGLKTIQISIFHIFFRTFHILFGLCHVHENWAIQIYIYI